MSTADDIFYEDSATMLKKRRHGKIASLLMKAMILCVCVTLIISVVALVHTVTLSARVKENSLAINSESGTIQNQRREVDRIKDEVIILDKAEGLISCLEDDRYIHNPVSNTCLRVVRKGKRWNNANASCHEANETLAVFDSRASIDWFQNFQRENTDWDLYFWIGARKISGTWRWAGTTNAEITEFNWGDHNPDAGFCVKISNKNDFKWRAESCGRRYYSLCERSSNLENKTSTLSP